MSGDSGQKFINRNRKPRVHITYADPYDADKQVELPFVMGVLSDLSGNSSPVEKPPLADRKFLDFTIDNFEERMRAIQPTQSFAAANKLVDGSADKLNVQLSFSSMQDFGPAAIARQVPALAKLMETRERLANLLSFMDGRSEAAARIKELLADPQLMESLKGSFLPPPAAGSAEEKSE